MNVGQFGAALVIISVIAELVIAWIEPSSLELFLKASVIPDAGVAIGIVGEIASGMWNNRLQTELRTRSNKELGEAKKFAAEAGRRAATAHARASASLAIASTARDNAFRLRKELAEANERTEKLRVLAAWRRLDQKQHETLALSLRASGDGASVRFCVLMNDQESLHFAQLISGPFVAAGWAVGYRFESYTHGIMTGILLPETQENWLEEMKDVNERVHAAFIAAEISFVNGWPLEPYMYTDDNAPLGAPIAWVYVGPKPMPLLG